MQILSPHNSDKLELSVSCLKWKESHPPVSIVTNNQGSVSILLFFLFCSLRGRLPCDQDINTYLELIYSKQYCRGVVTLIA